MDPSHLASTTRDCAQAARDCPLRRVTASVPSGSYVSGFQKIDAITRPATRPSLPTATAISNVAAPSRNLTRSWVGSPATAKTWDGADVRERNVRSGRLLAGSRAAAPDQNSIAPS